MAALEAAFGKYIEAGRGAAVSLPKQQGGAFW